MDGKIGTRIMMMMFFTYVALVVSGSIVSVNARPRNDTEETADRANVTAKVKPTVEAIVDESSTNKSKSKPVQFTTTLWNLLNSTVPPNVKRDQEPTQQSPNITLTIADELPVESANDSVAAAALPGKSSVTVVTVPIEVKEATTEAVASDDPQTTMTASPATNTDEEVEQDFLTSLKEAVRKVVNFSVGVMLTPFLIGAQRVASGQLPTTSTPNSLESNQIDTDYAN